MFPCLKPIADLSVAFWVRLTVLSLRAVTWLPRTPELCFTVATPPLRVFLSSGCQLVHISTCPQTNLKRLFQRPVISIATHVALVHVSGPPFPFSPTPSLAGSLLQILLLLILTFKGLSLSSVPPCLADLDRVPDPLPHHLHTICSFTHALVSFCVLTFLQALV